MSISTPMWGLDRRDDPNHIKERKTTNRDSEDDPDQLGHLMIADDDFADALTKLELEEIKAEILKFFYKSEDVVHSTEDVVSEVVSSRDLVLDALIDLYKGNIIERKAVGSSFVWWPSFEILPENIAGMEEDLDVFVDLIYRHKKPSETFEKAYSRVKGSPNPEILMDIVSTPTEDSEHFRHSIESRNDGISDSKEELVDRFR